MTDNMSSSISFSGRAFSISGRTSIKVAATKVSPHGEDGKWLRCYLTNGQIN